MPTRYYLELLNFCARWLKDRDAATDVVQESYARFLSIERASEAVAQPRALLYQTARRIMVDEFRRSRVRQHASLDGLADVGPPEASTDLNPEAIASANQMLDAYWLAISALSPRCREAFILHAFEGLTRQEIAMQMGTTVSMVEKHLARARVACRLCERRLAGPA